jgi:hypothetical protein
MIYLFLLFPIVCFVGVLTIFYISSLSCKHHDITSAEWAKAIRDSGDICKIRNKDGVE